MATMAAINVGLICWFRSLELLAVGLDAERKSSHREPDVFRGRMLAAFQPAHALREQPSACAASPLLKDSRSRQADSSAGVSQRKAGVDSRGLGGRPITICCSFLGQKHGFMAWI